MDTIARIDAIVEAELKRINAMAERYASDECDGCTDLTFWGLLEAHFARMAILRGDDA